MAPSPQPARTATTGLAESPGIFEVFEVLGRNKTVKRLERAIKTIESGSDMNTDKPADFMREIIREDLKAGKYDSRVHTLSS